MTKKELLLQSVKCQVAEDGHVDMHSTRIYVENRISRKIFNEACSVGLAIYNARKEI